MEVGSSGSTIRWTTLAYFPSLVGGIVVALATGCWEWHGPSQVGTSMSSSFESFWKQCNGVHALKSMFIPKNFMARIVFLSCQSRDGHG